MLRSAILVAVFLTLSPAVRAQEPAYRDDMRFAEALRNRGDNDLALEFLQQIAKGASPEVLKELTLEFAKTRLRVAADEPETAKRLAQYRSARADFQKFIDENPGHPRIAEANIDIARVLNFQGKTELNQAMLADEAKTKRELAQQSRTTLEEAFRKLQAAGKELEANVGKLPDPDSIKDIKEKRAAELARFRAESEVKETELDRALNLYDQASAYILVNNDDAASKILEKAKELLDPLSAGDPRQPITWKARAWLGRVLAEIDTTDKGHAKFLEVRNAHTNPAAFDGIRLARYFQLKVYKEKPRPEDTKFGVNKLILIGARPWRLEYPRYYNTPEGHGLAFLLAETLAAEADKGNKKLAEGTKFLYRREARVLLTELENSENEFTDRARRLKIYLMKQQGLFEIPIAKLTTFEDCFVRAQFEASELSREKVAAKSKVHIDNILLALQKALTLADVKKMRPSLELNTARAMYTYWAMSTGKLPEAIRVGEKFAREDPRSSQAEMSAVYALQAYAKVVQEKLSKFEEDAQAFRLRMFSLASYMEDRWPKTIAGDLARHSIGIQLLREENFRESIKKLSLISPSYGSYTLVCFQIADACNKAEKGRLEPIPGDRPGDFKKRSILALSSMPDSALGLEPFTNHLTISGKSMLGIELYRMKRFQQMDDLATAYLARIEKLQFNADADKDTATRNQMRFELVYVKVLARYGLAEAAFQAGEFARVAEVLDPLVDAAAGPDSQEKATLQKNQQLGMGLLILALRSNIQIGKIERTDVVLGVIESISGDEGGAINILKLLSFLIRGQIDDLRKQGDKPALEKAIAGYAKILDKRTAKVLKPTLEFTRAVAECYSSMGKHHEAATALEKVPDPKAKPGTEEYKNYRAIQLILSREYRLSGVKANIKKARALIDKIMAAGGKKDLLVLMEDGRIMEAEEKYPEAFSRWGNLGKRLQPNVGRGGVIKDRFLECSIHQIESYYRMGLTKPAKADRDKYVGKAASQLAALEASWGDDFGSESAKKQVTELLSAEPALKQQFEALRKKKK